MVKRIALLAAIASGWLVAAVLWVLFRDEYDLGHRVGYSEGLADCDDREAQRAGA